MADQLLELTVRVNSETGQLDVVSQKLKGLSADAGKAEQSLSGAGSGFKALQGAMGGLLTVAAIGGFFKSAVQGAEEENQALRRLKVAVESTGQSFASSSAQINAWALGIQAASRFTDGQAIDTMARFVRVTGDTTQAQKASQLAMSLSVATGKDLSQTIEILTNIINKNERGVMMARKEFGALIAGAENGQQVLDILSAKFGDAATKEEGFSKATASLRNNWDELKDTVGNAVIPVLTTLTGLLNKGIDYVRALGDAVAAQGALFVTIVEGVGKAVMALVRRDFGSLAEITRDTGTRISAIVTESFTMIRDEFDKTTAAHAIHADTRIQQNAAIAEKERETRAQKESEQAESDARIVQMADSLENRLLNIGAAANKKKAQNERAALKQSIAYAEAEAIAKRNAAFQIVDDSLAALSIINSMQSGHTKAQVTRARVILALEKAIAIARLWSAEAGKGMVGIGLATAGTALIVAQFAQQSKAIGEAARVSDSGSQEFRVDTAIGPGQTLSEISTNGAALPQGGGGGVSIGGSSSGGGAAVVINIGPTAVYFSAESVDLQNVDAIARRLGEAVTRGNVEAAQMALAVYRAGQNQEGLAR
ncbi:MAG: hypothetical protein E6Q97_26470 [Desulfurellales bacterium]|nr:MAG: hypothetical protein E6Q97_26470 [Desulfurellales bacterium]